MGDDNPRFNDPLGQLLKIAVVGWLVWEAGWLLLVLPILLVIAWFIASLLA